MTDVVWLNLAKQAALNGTCRRGQVGAILVERGILVSSGWNTGLYAGGRTCLTQGCTMEDGHCVATIHAEAHAVAGLKFDLVNATMYSTLSPCWNCFKLVYMTGIRRIVFSSLYPTGERSILAAKELGVEMVHIP